MADFNGDGSLDLALALANGEVWCYFNDLPRPLGVNVRPGKGVVVSVTVSLWQGEKSPVCVGAWSVSGAALLPVRLAGDCTIKYTLPGKPTMSRTIDVSDKPGAKPVQLTLE